jgi:hypothetical protein
MKKAAFVLTMLMVGGCAGGASNRADDGAYKARQLCQNTAIGADAKRVCY